MTSDSPPPPPRPSDGSVPRAALERVLARAAELQLAGSEAPDTISEAQLLEIGREVGLDPDALRMAIAEERGRSPRLPDTPGRIERALGEAHVSAQRTVPATPEAALATLDRWLQREEQFIVKRRFGQRMSWERQRNPFAAISRSLSGKPADLQKVDEVSVVVTAIDDSRALVRLDGDMRRCRKSQKDGTVVLAVVNGVVVAVWLTPLVILSLLAGPGGNAAPVAVGAMVGVGLHAGVSALVWSGIKRTYRQAVARAQLRLEQLLDALEHGDPGAPPSLLEQLKQSLNLPTR
jgi:hypothetical protein